MSPSFCGSGSTTRLSLDFSYIKSLFANENFQILPAPSSSTSPNTHEYILTSTSPQKPQMTSHSMPSIHTPPREHRAKPHRPRRHRARIPQAETKGTQTSLDDHQTEAPPQEPVPIKRAQPSMGTSSRRVPIAQVNSNGSENLSHEYSPRDEHTYPERVLSEGVPSPHTDRSSQVAVTAAPSASNRSVVESTPAPPATGRSVVESTPARGQHLSDVVQNIVAAQRSRDPG